MSEKCSCNIKKCVCNMSCETKLLFVLLIALTIFVIVETLNFNKKTKKWIEKNPEEILKSVENYVNKKQSEEEGKRQETSSKAVKENLGKLRNTENTGVLNHNGKKFVTVFYDYKCGYCKMASKTVEEVAKDKNVKVIFVDSPIMGEISEIAARYSVAVAIAEPNKFAEFHSNLFEGPLNTLSDVKNILRKSKISVEKIEKVLKDKNEIINQKLGFNRDLAIAIGLQGTPAFVAGETLIPGAVNAEQLVEILNKQ